MNTFINMEYMAEKWIKYLKKDIKDEQVENYLFIFELIKLYKKLISYTGKKQIYIEQIEEVDINNCEKVMKNYTKPTPSDLKEKIKSSLNNLDSIKYSLLNKKANTPQLMLNQNKILNIPSNIDQRLIYLKKKKRIIINIVEYISFIRPIIYYFMRKIYGYDSYKPYTINIIIEILIYLVNLIVMKSKILNNDIIKNRIKISIINNLLRNPVYKRFIRYNIEYFLNKVVFINIFKSLFMNLIEYRASQSFLF